jgi:hypothetical protein
MKTTKLLLIFTFLSIFVSQCKKSSTDDLSQPPVNVSCKPVTDCTITQQSGNLNISITNSTTPLYYEVVLGNLNFIIGSSAILNIDSLGGLPTNQPLVYSVRSVCSSSDKSLWSTEKAITLNPYCNRPYGLGIASFPDGKGLFWQVSNNSTVSSFQVQYGIRGFTLGTGSVSTVSSPPFTSLSLVANTNYDLYVRSDCSAGLGWSDWAGPYTYFATANQHLCLAPSNVTYQIVRNGLGQAVGAAFQWAQNGETSFEYTFVNSFQTVSAGTIQTIDNLHFPTLLVTQNTLFHFYVRAVCLDGSRTNWTGPLAFNIGH